MITRNTTSPSFGELRVDPSYKKLGHQGQKALDIIRPIANDITDGFVTTIGAASNPQIGNKPTLMVMAIAKTEEAKGFLAKFKSQKVPVLLFQSSTPAINPDLLTQNIVIPQEAILAAENKPLKGMHEIADEFFSKPEVEKSLDEFDASYTRVPTWDELDYDAMNGSETAAQNGYKTLNPFGDA